MNKQRKPTHPQLREDILPAMDMSSSALARQLHMSRLGGKSARLSKDLAGIKPVAS